jgi:CDP-diglyceride synthetase
VTAAEISAALAGIRRHSRLLEQASGRQSWWGFTFTAAFAVGACATGWYLVDEVSPGIFALFIVLALAVGVADNQLQRRVDAITRLLAEIGYPGKA